MQKNAGAAFRALPIIRKCVKSGPLELLHAQGHLSRPKAGVIASSLFKSATQGRARRDGERDYWHSKFDKFDIVMLWSRCDDLSDPTRLSFFFVVQHP